MHRIGRTGRAQREGDAFTLITGEDNEAARDVERYLGEKVERLQIEGFPYGPIPVASEESRPQQQGRRSGGGGGRRPQRGGGGGRRSR